MLSSQTSSNYYKVGGSLHLNAPSYVVRQADRELYQALYQGEFCYVLNCRQMGKSSLRVRTMQRLKQKGLCCIAIDMTRVGSEYVTPAQWYEQVIAELWRGAGLMGQLNLKTWLSEHQTLSHVRLLNQFIETVLLAQFQTQGLVIFIDEIDSLLSLPFAIDDFFALIRAYYNQRVDDPRYEQLSFCLLGVATPADLISDKLRTPFNIGHAIALNGFSFEEAQPLLAGLPHQPEQTLRRILAWTGGQPFLTQKLCQLMAHSSGSVDQIIQTQIIQTWETQDEPEHLRTIRDRLLRNERLASRLLGLYQQVLAAPTGLSADDSREQIELRLSGLAVRSDARLRVYNPIYAAVFDQDWIERSLDNLRPYAEAFRAWIRSDRQDESRLLRGRALEDASQWATGRSLSGEDTEFLRLSQTVENRETKQANRILTQANRTAKRRFRISAAFLMASVVASAALGLATLRARQIAALDQRSISVREDFTLDKTQGLIEAMKTADKLRSIAGGSDAKYPTDSPVLTLQHVLPQMQLQEYRTRSPYRFTAQGDRYVSLWSSDVSLLKLLSFAVKAIKQD
jgi:hypothetical protein